LVTDIFVELKELALASRLRRLSERMMEEGEELYAELGLEFRPRWFPLFYALSRHSPQAITGLARVLGLSHPAVNKIAGELLRAGLIRESRDRGDERKRLLSLTAKGRQSLSRLGPVWRGIRAAVRDLLAEADVDLVRDLKRVEDTFANRSVVERVRERLLLPSREKLAIVGYRPAYKKYFKSLNKEWLQRHFSVEEHDAELLEDPNGKIIKRGGSVFFALLDDEVVGTCALVRSGTGTLELCKMAVARKARQKGIGTPLVRAAVARARELGARELLLRTSPKLKAACRLYRRLDFRTVRANEPPHPDYKRRSITMRLDLARARMEKGRKS